MRRGLTNWTLQSPAFRRLAWKLGNRPFGYIKGRVNNVITGIGVAIGSVRRGGSRGGVGWMIFRITRFNLDGDRRRIVPALISINSRLLQTLARALFLLLVVRGPSWQSKVTKHSGTSSTLVVGIWVRSAGPVTRGSSGHGGSSTEREITIHEDAVIADTG